MYYGLFVRVGGKFVRVDATSGYTLETAKEKFRPLVLLLLEKGLKAEFRPLRPVRLIDTRAADRKYACTPW